MNTAIDIAAVATESNESFSTGLNWKRPKGFIRPTVYALAFTVFNFVLITAVSYDYAVANVA